MTHNRLMACDKFMTNNKQNGIGLINYFRMDTSLYSSNTAFQHTAH